MHALVRLVITGFCAGFYLPLLFAQTTVNISGTVSSSRGGALSGVAVTLKNSRLSGTTDAAGAYRINGITPVKEQQGQLPRDPGAYFLNNTLLFSVHNSMPVLLSLINTQGAVVSQLLPKRILPPDDYRFELNKMPAVDGVYFLRLVLGGNVAVFSCVLLAVGAGSDVKNAPAVYASGSGSAKTAAVVDTLVFARPDYDTLKMPTETYNGECNAKMFIKITHGTQLTQADVGLSGGTLTPVPIAVSKSHGHVIENLSVTGQIRIQHHNVTVRNCLIKHGNGLDGILVSGGCTGVLIEHCEMDGLDQVLGNYGSMGVVVQDANATVRRCYMHNVRSGMSILDRRGTGSFIENYVRDLCSANGAHNTSASCHGTPGPHAVLRNSFVEGNSSAYSLYSDNGSNTNVLVQDNLFIGQRQGYGIYGGYTHLENGYAQSNRSIRFIGNRFRPQFGWGPCAAMKMDQPGAVWEDNKYENGTVIPPKETI